jgi:REP element-mobilizing transposase RayT
MPEITRSIYGEYNALFNLETLEIIEGDLPNRATKMVVEWATIYQSELLKMWNTQEFNLFGSNSPPLAAYNRKMSEYIHKSHNVSVLLYHLVFPAKYRKAVFDEQVDSLLKEVCLEMEKRYEIKFVEIGVDKDHVHFLVQSVPTYSVTRIVRMIKSITAREIFKKCPQVKKQLWGGEFWSDGYYASTVGKHGDEGMIARYVKEQDKEYLQLHQNLQLSLF